MKNKVVHLVSFVDHLDDALQPCFSLAHSVPDRGGWLLGLGAEPDVGVITCCQEEAQGN